MKEQVPYLPGRQGMARGILVEGRLYAGQRQTERWKEMQVQMRTEEGPQ